MATDALEAQPEQVDDPVGGVTSYSIGKGNKAAWARSSIQQKVVGALPERCG